MRYGASVTGLAAEDGRMTGVEIGGETLKASRVIVSTGGSSYPATGTTGDGWCWLSALGHTLVPLKAALAPMYLTDVEVGLVRSRTCGTRFCGHGQASGGKEFARWSGDLLFTHKGVSGPTALGVSRDVAEREALPAALEADLAPDRTWEELAADLRRQALENPRKTVASLAAPFVPARLLEPLLGAAGIPGDTRGAYLKAKSLNKLVSTLKGWPLGAVRHVPLERGEVVAGGVSLDEVDSQTMRSNRVDGLFLCGEVLDIAGPVGGYNLQAAWSTGWVAGESAANDWNRH